MKMEEISMLFIVSKRGRKNAFENHHLSENNFLLKVTLEEPNFPAHQYAFYMDDYLKSKGAIGIVEISQIDY